MNEQITEDFDLTAAAERTEAVHVVKHPVTGATTSARIVVSGPEHAVRKAAVFARMRVRRAELINSGMLKASDPQEDEIDQTEFIATCTLGWTGLAVDGAALPFAIGAPLKLYSDPRFRWLRDQVLEAMDKRELFIGACATA